MLTNKYTSLNKIIIIKSSSLIKVQRTIETLSTKHEPYKYYSNHQLQIYIKEIANHAKIYHIKARIKTEQVDKTSAITAFMIKGKGLFPLIEGKS